MDTHEENYLSTQEGKNLPVEHCIKDTHGWQISEALADFAKQAKAVVEKPTFGSMELIQWLDGVDEVELVGLCTEICVISNAMLIKAAYPETVVSVDSACCAGVTPDRIPIYICHSYLRGFLLGKAVHGCGKDTQRKESQPSCIMVCAAGLQLHSLSGYCGRVTNKYPGMAGRAKENRQ